MAGMSPTARTIKYLRDQGYIGDVVERFNAYAGKFGQRKDFLGFADLIVVKRGEGVIAVQSTGSAHSEHVRKLSDSECTTNMIEWLESGARVWILSWRKVLLKRGGKAKRWEPRKAEFRFANGELTIEEKGKVKSLGEAELEEP